MRFRVIREMTTAMSIGTGPDTALGAFPTTRMFRYGRHGQDPVRQRRKFRFKGKFSALRRGGSGVIRGKR